MCIKEEKSSFYFTQLQPSHGLFVYQVVEFREALGFFGQLVYREGSTT